ncbi:MAG: hypothetical protein ACLTKG_07195 [Collinsella intestinalis]
MEVDDVVRLLQGNTCGLRKTSCRPADPRSPRDRSDGRAMRLAVTAFRRRFLAGSAAATAVTAACSPYRAAARAGSHASGQPQVVDDASRSSTCSMSTRTRASIAQAGEWSLPSVRFCSTARAVVGAMMTPESASRTASASFRSRTAPLTPIGSPTLAVRTAFDVRASSGVFSWVEIEYATLSWTLLARSFADGSLSGDAVELDHGDSTGSRLFTCTGSSVIWQKMPSTSGSKTSEKSHCYRWSVGDGSSNEEIWESLGASRPHRASKGSTIVPACRTTRTYYGMTAVHLSSPVHEARPAPWPAGVRPFEAVYMGDSFVIEASYDGGEPG